MDADHIAALALGIIAILWLIIAVACVLVGSDRRRPRPTSPPALQSQAPDLDSEAARRYHGSNQWGR